MQAELQVAVVVQVVNDVLGQLADGRFAVEEAELFAQVVVERPRARGHVLHGVLLAIALLAERGPAPSRALVVELAPVLVHPDQAVEFVRLLRRLGLGDGRRPRLLALSVGGRGRFPQVHQDGVLAQLLLDPLLQGHDRQLQDLHRLDHPRRHPQAHLGSHLLRGIKPHEPILSSVLGRGGGRT